MDIALVLNALNNFGGYLHSDDLDQLCDDFNNEIHYTYGASRWCITCNDWDFVLKFPRYVYTSLDYCALEADNYLKAKSYGIADILLPIEHIYTTQAGLPIYKQPKITTAMCDLSEERSKALAKKVETVIHSVTFQKCVQGCHDGWRIPRVWFGRVIQLYGKRFVRAFEAWTAECKVNDLHNSNVGFKNGKPIILDYAGFHE